MGVFDIFSLFLIALYTMWVIYLVLQWRTARTSEESEDVNTHIAIIIAFRNEAHHLRQLLTLITRELQHTPHVEIILVDDGSEDASREIAQPFENARVRMISNDVKPGKKGSIHAGIANTQAEWLLTLDADAMPCREWLVQAVRHIEANQAADLLIFPVWMEDKRNFLSRLQEMEWLSILGVTGGMALGGQSILCNGANMAFRKDVYHSFQEVRNDWDLASGDDFFLMEHAKEVVWIHDTRAGVVISAEPTLTGFLHQRVRWAGKTSRTHKIKTKLIGALVWITNGLLILAPWIAEHWIFLFAIKMLVDALLMVTVSRWLCKRYSFWLYPVLALIYPCYAIAIPLLGKIWPTTWKGRKIALSR